MGKSPKNEKKKMWRRIGVAEKGLGFFLSTEIENLIHPECLVVVAGLDILRMKAASIEHHEPVGPHVDKFE